MEVYLSEHIAPSAYARLARHFEIVDNFDHPERLAAMIIRRAVVPRAVIAHAPNLKVIAMHGVSRDTIDTAAAAEFGVPVPNVPGLGAPAVAELAVADLLALNRQLKFVNNGLCAGRFDHFGAEEFVCHEMTGRTLGLVGTGNIAHRVADILRAAFDFDPDGMTTRAMLVSILYRMAGEPDVSELPETPFEDVGPDAWYADAVRWAYANEVAAGMVDTHFAPDDRLTRAQLVTMLYRAYGPEKGVRPRPIGGYTDWNTVPEWAYPAATWAVSMGLLYGTSSSQLSPNAGANRAQLAAFMMRTCELQSELDA